MAEAVPGRPRLVIFDLDGTLVDSAPDLAVAVDAALAASGLPEPGEERVRAWIGGGARLMLQRALAWAGEADPRAGADALYPAFVERYAARIAVRSRPYPGVEALLGELGAAGHLLAVVTNKAEGLARRLLAALDLAARLRVVIGGDSVAEKKPSPLPLLAAAHEAGVAPRAAVMVGDAAVDIRAARAAGMRALAAAWGYGGRAALVAEAPDALLASPAEVATALASPPRV